MHYMYNVGQFNKRYIDLSKPHKIPKWMLLYRTAAAKIARGHDCNHFFTSLISKENTRLQNYD